MTSRSGNAAMLSVLVVLGIATMSSAAAAQDSCEPFTVSNVMDERIVAFLNQGAEETGPGDMRIGYMPLVDGAGNRVGHQRWNLLVLDPILPEDEGRAQQRIVTEVLVFDKGEIFIMAIPSAANPPQETGQPSVRSFEGAVVGGTGVFAFARGTATRTFGDGTASFELNIRCD